MRLLVATRSGHKLREIRTILGEVPGVELLDLNDVGVGYAADEEEIEVFETFEENAAAKARYFRDRTGMPTVADDSGLVVDALDGAPGVHSKRFAPPSRDLSPEDRDRANNEHLLELLGDLELPQRTARYVCVAVLEPGGTALRGEVEGLILDEPRGEGGFGYDPLFFHPPAGRTFGELSAREKDQRSHRGAAFRALASHLLGSKEVRSKEGRP